MENPETNPISLLFRTIAKHYTGLIAIMLVGSACYIWLGGKELPAGLEHLTLMVVSFLFGRGTASLGKRGANSGT
jgi:hypothetical protein